MMKICNFLWRKKAFLWTRVLDIDLSYAITGYSRLSLNTIWMTYPHPQQKKIIILTKNGENFFLNWEQKRCIFFIVSCFMYAVRVCQLFPTRFGSFVHSSLQIFRCFIKHNTKKYFFKLCQNLHISQPIFIWNVPLYVVPYYPELYFPQ